MDHKHHFSPATFSRFTYCDGCARFIWGVKLQGLQCRECGYACHYGCEDKAVPHSRAEPSRSTPLERARLDVQSSSAPCGTTDEASTTDIVKYLVVAANAEASEQAAQQTPVSEYLEHQPPLNPQTTAKNFSRFIGRCGPVFALRDAAILLISWENPLNTWIAVLIYSLVCVYPKLVLVAPQAAISFALFRHGRKQHEAPRSKKPAGATAEASSSTSTSTSTSTGTGTGTGKNALDPHSVGDDNASSHNDGMFGNAFNISIPLLGSGTTSPEYSKNLQNIQNTMAEVSDAHDALVSYAQHWTRSEESTEMLRRLLLASALATLVCLWMIPLNYILLAAGLGVFFANTRFAKALVRLVRQDRILLEKVLANIDAWRTAVTSHMKSDPPLTARTVSVFENQRSYDGGQHYLPKLEPSDRRTSWTNLSGSVSFEDCTCLQPPQGFRWEEGSEWTVDEKGPWQEPYLGIEVNLVVGG